MVDGGNLALLREYCNSQDVRFRLWAQGGCKVCRGVQDFLQVE